MNRFIIEISDDEIKKAVIEKFADHIEWGIRSDIEKSIKEFFKTVDQAELNKHITRVLISKTIGEMK